MENSDMRRSDIDYSGLPPKPKSVFGGPVHLRIQYDIMVTDGGMPDKSDKPEICHLCLETIAPFDLICRDKEHYVQPMHMPCFERWLSTLEDPSNTSQCHLSSCVRQHAITFNNYGGPSHKVWTFWPAPVPQLDLPADAANNYARLFLSYMLAMNSFNIDNLDNWSAWRDWSIVRTAMGGSSMERLQGMKLIGWNGLSWPARIEILVVHRMTYHPGFKSFIRAANGGRSLEDIEFASTREFMIQLAVDYLLEYMRDLVMCSRIQIEEVANVCQTVNPFVQLSGR